ncbi:MAG: phosphomannomutase/phosphoglucomutase [Pseudomarimonas sp.]
MAKRKPEPKTGIPIDPALRKLLTQLFALLAFVIGGYLFWQGAQSWVGMRGGDQALAARDRLAVDLAKQLDSVRERFAGVAADPKTLADVAAGEPADATKRISAGWKELTGTKVFTANLDEAFADPQSVGWGRMAVLSSSLVSPKPTLGLVGRGDNLAIGIATPLLQDRVLGVLYGELPLSMVTQPLEAVAAGGGLLQIASGSTIVAEYGDTSLRSLAVPVPVGDSIFRITAAKPAGSSEMLDLLKPFVLGLMAWVLGGVLLGRSRRSMATADEGDNKTFAEVLAAESGPVASAAPSKSAKAERGPARIDRSIFRAYDIRGVLGLTLDEGVAKVIGQAVGSTLTERGLREIVVGRDGRLSGPSLSAALIEGLRLSGCDVIDIGMAPTPVIYFATHHLNTGSCIAVTGSHNPPDYNGFKIMIGGDTLSGDAIQALYTRISENDLRDGGGGGLQSMDIGPDYLSRIASDIQLERQIKIVIDAGNGVAGAIAPQVLESVGCVVEELYCEVDGNFPNHHPDPGDPENLHDLVTAVKRTGAELGIAFDGDGDRLGVVTRTGEVIYPDRVLMLFAQDVLSRNPGASIIYDVKCTGQLATQVLRFGGSPIMWKTGHSLIKAKMRETDAELAGEMSGHFFFRERWYGFDDGIYAAARLLEIIASDGREPEEIFAELPKGVSTPELKVQMVEGEHYAFMDSFRERARFEGAKIATIDGIRADWSDGWGLVRCSNTTPTLVLRFDADSNAALLRIQEAFRTQLLAVRPDLELPF